MSVAIAIGEFFVGIISIGGTIFSLAKDVTTVFPHVPCWIIIIFGVLLSISSLFIIVGSICRLIDVFREGLRKHKLSTGSRRFFKFFASWYAQPGKLTIICDDLDWITDGKDERIYHVLVRKSREKQLELLLGDGLHSDTVRRLQSQGALVAEAPAEILVKYTFSCLAVMGNRAGRIIVRDKSRDNSRKVIFEEMSNTYVTGLLNVLFASENREA